MELLRRFRFTMLLMLLTTLTACGGGDGGLSREGDNNGGSGGTTTTTTVLVDVTIDHTDVTSVNPATVTAKVTSDGSALAGVVVNFETTTGVLFPESGTALTDSNGEATIQVHPGTAQGAGSVTAVYGEVTSSPVGFTTAGDGSDVAGKVITISSTNSNITAASPAVLTALVMDAGQPVSGEVVTFTTTLGVIDPSTGTALTDSNGNATVNLAAGTVEGAGLITVTATSGESNTLGFSTAGDGTETGGDSLTISSFTNSTSISNANPAMITVHFAQADGTALVDEVITFTTTLGILDPVTGTALTDSSGNAMITLSAGDIKGAGVLTATSNAGNAVTQGFFTQGDGSVSGGNALSITTFTNSTSISNANPAMITVHFTQADGTALANEVITFSSTLGAFELVSGTALTDANGDASITLLAGNVKGAGVLSAQSQLGDVVSQGFFTQGDGVTSGVNVKVVLTDQNGNAIDQISSISPGKLTATVTGVTEAVIVTFKTDLGTIPVPTAIATVDSGFQASVELLAGNSLGAGTVVVSLSTGQVDNLVFSIGASDLGIGNAIDPATGLPDGLIGVPSGNISAGATAGLSVGIWDVSNASPSTPAVLFTKDTVEVTFSSGCSNLTTPTATIDSPVSTKAGIAQSTYLAKGCEGADTITATANAGGTTLSAAGVVSVNSADTGSIEFVSATPELISLQGVGGTESSTVVFRVLDTNGNPVPNADIDFSLNTDVGGINFSPVSAKTDSNGLVQTVVNSGTIHTSVRVRAEVNGSNPLKFTQSNLLVISTGIPDQDSFSLSASQFNPEAWNIDGTEVTITARLADAFNNPAPDGTAVSFTTEGGAIEDSCVTSNGACSVKWTSQNVRPEGQELGQVNNGPTMVEGAVDISKGMDFSTRAISFDVTSNAATDSITLSSNYSSKFDLLEAVNNQLSNTTVKAASGFENTFKLISLENQNITITDTSVGSVTTKDVLGLSDGTTYYYSATTVLGSVNVLGGKDFSVSNTSFDVATTDGTDTVLLNANYASVTDILNKINTDLATSGVKATEFVYAGASYIVLSSDTRLDIKVTDGGSAMSTLAALGFSDGSTFPTRINSSSPQRTNFMGQTYGGRATITATAIGEESFPDLNGNGVYDSTEEDAFLGQNGAEGLDINGVPFDLAESFVDNNEDGVYNPEATAGFGESGGELEKFDDFNNTGVYDLKDGKYNGSLCGSATNCSATKSLNVRGSLTLVMSGSHPRFVTTYPTNGDDINIVSDGTGYASVIIADLHNQPMPAGTTVTFEATVGTAKGGPYTWPSESSNRGRAFAVTVEGVKDKTISGPLNVIVTTPGGTETIYSVATINITP